MKLRMYCNNFISTHHFSLPSKVSIMLSRPRPRQFNSRSSKDVTASTPPIRLNQLATSYARASHLHHEHIQLLLRSLLFQHQAIRIASTTLDFNVLAISETFEGIALNARKQLEKQSSLLAGLDSDLELISRVGVHVEFCSAAVRMAIEAGDPHRVLGDYVSKHKMKQVADACVRTHGSCLYSSKGLCLTQLQMTCSLALFK
jgi:acid stress-induced BolA-like protein IbaG/YrbA